MIDRIIIDFLNMKLGFPRISWSMDFPVRIVLQKTYSYTLFQGKRLFLSTHPELSFNHYT